ncbi:hypothetical protein R6Q59_003176 [Mikania micrantha]
MRHHRRHHPPTSFPGKATGARVFAQAPSSEAAPVKEVAKEAATADEEDDDLDLFGGKSSVLMNVKPWDDETTEAVRSVEMPCLLWGAWYHIQLSHHKRFKIWRFKWKLKGDQGSSWKKKYEKSDMNDMKCNYK